MGSHRNRSRRSDSSEREYRRERREKRGRRDDSRDRHRRSRHRDRSSERSSRRYRDDSYDRRRKDKSPHKRHSDDTPPNVKIYQRSPTTSLINSTATTIDVEIKNTPINFPTLNKPIINPNVAFKNTFINNDNNESSLNNNETVKKRRKASRFAPETDRFAVPGIPVAIAADMDEKQRKLYLIQLRIEEIGLKLRTGNLGVNDPSVERSPSPEPIYNTMGIRQNTRELRVRQKLEDERHRLINEAKELNPEYKPPLDYRPTSTKITDKVMIPQDVHPSINFIGLLIGPRGNTLKRLESESNTKIIIRGKGSLKEGKLRTQPLPGEDEPLHALVTANNPEDLRKGMALIQSIIEDGLANPDGDNELRRMQLRELAQLNGTLIASEISRCKNCGASDHRHWECPQAKNITNITICDRCGGGGHIASDCIYDGERAQTAEEKSKLDSAYKELMTELGVKSDGIDILGNVIGGDDSNGKNIPSILALPKVVVSQLPWVNVAGGHLAGNSGVPLALPSTVPMPPPITYTVPPPTTHYPNMPNPTTFAPAPLAEAFGLPQQPTFPQTGSWPNSAIPNIVTNTGVSISNVNNNSGNEKIPPP